MNVIDVSEPKKPKLVSEIYDEDGQFSLLKIVRWISVSGNYAYIASIVDSSLTIVDISDPYAPKLAAEIADGI